jgi:hypothetical protein
MKRAEALELLNEMRKKQRYWLPDGETRLFLQDIDFDVRIGKTKELPEEAAGRLREIHRAFKRCVE